MTSSFLVKKMATTFSLEKKRMFSYSSLQLQNKSDNLFEFFVRLSKFYLRRMMMSRNDYHQEGTPKSVVVVVVVKMQERLNPSRMRPKKMMKKADSPFFYIFYFLINVWCCVFN